jgi:hypothetical protein
MTTTSTVILVIISLLILGWFLLLVAALCHAASVADSVADDEVKKILARLKKTEQTNKPTDGNTPHENH